MIGGKEWVIPDDEHFRGVSIDWFYAERNALAFTIEMPHVLRDDVDEVLPELVEKHVSFLLELAETLPLEGRGR